MLNTYKAISTNLTKSTTLAILFIISICILPTPMLVNTALASEQPSSAGLFCERLRFCFLQKISNEHGGDGGQWAETATNNFLDGICDMMVAAQRNRGTNSSSAKQAEVCLETMAKMECDKFTNLATPTDLALPKVCG